MVKMKDGCIFSSVKQLIPVKNKIAGDRHLKIAPFRKDIRITKPHKHKQYFEIVFLSSGKGIHWIDGIGHEVRPPLIFFINKDQTHYWDLNGEPEGYVVILKNSFLQRSRDDSLKQLLHRIWHANCIYLETASQMNVLFSLMTDHADRFSVNDQHAIDGLLKTLIARVLEESSQHSLQTGPPTRLYSQYIELLSGRQNLHNSIAFYARTLHTTPQTLNAACRRSANRSASEILNDFVINEAQRLLLYTDNHVNEVAQLLGFNDSSYFIKFFKKYRKFTPEEFRKAQHGL